jgi:pimeloyl-ACP methyl ester carboxylesterase
VDVTETRYARNGDVHLAYQVVGDGPLDLLYVPSWISQVEHRWEHPRVAAYFERLSRVGRLIIFDRRGTGMSDPLGDDVGGMAVHIGARVAALAGGGEVLVSSTVRDLVVGSGLPFTDRGEHDLRGVPGPWRLFAVG